MQVETIATMTLSWANERRDIGIQHTWDIFLSPSLFFPLPSLLPRVSTFLDNSRRSHLRMSIVIGSASQAKSNSIPISIQQLSSSSTQSENFSTSSSSSLLLSHRPIGRKVIIIGTGKLAVSRVNACQEAGVKCIVVAVEQSCFPQPSTSTFKQDSITCVDLELEDRCKTGEIQWFSGKDLSLLPNSSEEGLGLSKESSIEASWNKFLSDQDQVQNSKEPQIFGVCVTDTLHLAINSNSTSTSSTSSNQALFRANLLSKICKQKRIPINVADKPHLCDFSFPATHRFNATSHGTPSKQSSSYPSSLQIAVTTNGRGCRLASRIRREIVASLPKNVGDAVEKVGEMREMAKKGDRKRRSSIASTSEAEEVKPVRPSMNGKKKPSRKAGREGSDEILEEDLNFDTTPLNSPVPQLSNREPVGDQLAKAGEALAKENKKTSTLGRELRPEESEEEEDKDAEDTKRRMRWVAQMSEYWPIDYLGSLTKDQMKDTLVTYNKQDEKVEKKDSIPLSTEMTRSLSDAPSRGRELSARNLESTDLSSSTKARRASSQHALDIGPPKVLSSNSKGNIYLLGAGTGHPGLLTVLALRILQSPTTSLILSDKLVPSSILSLIPSTTPLIIAKKFPGNAEGAQSELIALALKASLEGKNVVRLKQGDPFVYGRGGEEVLAFRKAGIIPTVVPGISSSLAAPLMLGIPVTQRGVSDSLLLCTGVGRGGKIVKLPGYERNRTVVLLMGVARLEAVVKALTEISSDSSTSTTNRNGDAFPVYTPIAIIERASSSDQRLIASTLEGVVKAMASEGEQRPPGMIVVGWSVLALEGKGGLDVMDDEIKSGEKTREDQELKEDQVEAKSKEELERRDRQRVEDWLKESGKGKCYVVKEGLDHVYQESLHALTSSSSVDEVEIGELSASTQVASNLNGIKERDHPTSSSGTTTPTSRLSNNPLNPFATTFNPASNSTQAPTFDLKSRTQTGWSEARYGATPTGGWVNGEGQNIPALDRLKYEQDLEYARAAAASAKLGKDITGP